jgi:hypothetical protein
VVTASAFAIFVAVDAFVLWTSWQDRELDSAQMERLAHHANEGFRGPDRSLRELIPEAGRACPLHPARPAA